MNPLHYQCLQAAVSIVGGLGLSGIGSRVYLQGLEDLTEPQYPCVLVNCEDESEQVEGLTTAARRVEYPAKLLLYDRTPPTPGLVPIYTGWREQVLDAFPDRRQASFPAGVYGVRVSMQVILKKQLPAYQFVRSGMVLWFRCTRAG